MMKIQVEEHVVRVQVLKLSGRIDAFTVAGLRETQETLLAQGAKRFIVDLSEVAFLDSSGMSALVVLLKRARQAGGDVALVSPSNPDAVRILSLTRFDQVFRMVNTVADALP